MTRRAGLRAGGIFFWRAPLRWGRDGKNGFDGAKPSELHVNSSSHENRRQLEALERLNGFKQSPGQTGAPLGPELVSFFKNAVQKRQTKLGKISECWGVLVPEFLADHCSLESLNRGTLVVLVDSSSHLYELKQLLLGGLEDQLMLACRSAGLRKITLKPGRWYDAAPDSGDRRPRFQ